MSRGAGVSPKLKGFARMVGKSVQVRVPATVGSLAGARNCAAVTLDASLNVKVTTRFDGRVSIRYFGEHGERVPRDRSNLVVQALEAALSSRGLEFAGADFEIYSSVPVAVGLGSSTAAVLAGLIAADRLFKLQLDETRLFRLAALYEDRNDSLRAAWLGGFVAASEESAADAYRRVVVPENFVLSVVVPEVSLLPGGWGAALDGSVQRTALQGQDPSGVDCFSQARALAEFFARPGSGRVPNLGAPVPPACKKVVPGLEQALQVRVPGLQLVFPCGSGPAVGVLTEEDPVFAVQAVQECFERQGVASNSLEFRLSNSGARELNAVPPDLSLPRASALSPPAKKISLIPV
jgi:homoserine kinase